MPSLAVFAISDLDCYLELKPLTLRLACRLVQTNSSLQAQEETVLLALPTVFNAAEPTLVTYASVANSSSLTSLPEKSTVLINACLVTSMPKQNVFNVLKAAGSAVDQQLA